jgi:hypothetical protein
MNIPLMEQARIQALVFVPMVKKLRAELGQERADAIAREARADDYRGFGAHVDFIRTRTIVPGASRCGFHFRVRKDTTATS